MATWKETLERYLQYRTQGLLGHIQEIDNYLEQGADAERIKQRFSIRRQQLAERKVEPLKSRMELSGLQVERESNSEVVVRIEAREWYSYHLEGQWHEQEKEERLRIILRKKGNKWIVMQEEPLRTTLEPEVHEVFQMERDEEGRSEERGYRYNRLRAVRYAEAWWNDYNPQFRHFDVDCTNFISQCLYAGGIPMRDTGNRASGWWYRGNNSPSALWSYSWAVAHSFRWYLERGKHIKTEIKTSPDQLSLGDVICYDFDGDGHWQHSTIVVAKDGRGMPLVNAHTTNSRHRYWDYRDSTAYTPQIQYRFFHIL
jgi:hypothetical protein